MSQPASLMTEAVTELVAIGAAIAASCEPCFRHHFDSARKLGVSREDMREAVNVALVVKATPHRKVVEAADHCLAEAGPEAAGKSRAAACGAGGCC
ncbi:carboxymuconolactone decarboxylase family protein [Geothrix campi]|uniref:carboxymuconolactone decarboxylase family protein n=1 Tax=Geothrix campi TaxID=2966450 RepID=UPI00214995A5|nr:carboxymuconolactone decarboxylase family protein [Geothrix sp. SG10]